MFASISLLTLLLITLLGQRSKAAAIYKLTSRAHTSIALSDYKSGGMAHTVAVQVGGTWLNVLVSTSDLIRPGVLNKGRYGFCAVLGGFPRLLYLQRCRNACRRAPSTCSM
jgi:hypothetical protein